MQEYIDDLISREGYLSALEKSILDAYYIGERKAKSYCVRAVRDKLLEPQNLLISAIVGATLVVVIRNFGR